MIIYQKVYLTIEIDCFLMTYIFFDLFDANPHDLK